MYSVQCTVYSVQCTVHSVHTYELRVSSSYTYIRAMIRVRVRVDVGYTMILNFDDVYASTYSTLDVISTRAIDSTRVHSNKRRQADRANE